LARPQPEVVLFIDECLGSVDVPNALIEVGARVELLRDHFASDTPDEVWLADVGARGWLVLTKDDRNRHRQSERRALRASLAAVFALAAKNLKGPQMGQAFARAYPRMSKLARAHERPFVASEGATGEVRLLTEVRRKGARRRTSKRRGERRT